MADFHKPVMLAEVLGFLNPQSGGTFIDCTLGGGGHALEIAKRVSPEGKLVGIDQDEEALQVAADYLADYKDNVILENGNFSEIASIARKLDVESVNGILMDLGVSSHQLDAPERGFSFRYDAPLDMRMDKSQPVDAAELVNSLAERNLAEYIFRYGEERWARRIAKFIVDRRGKQPIQTTGELVEIILAAVPSGARQTGIHPATRTFQALRIVVNRELEALEKGLDAAIDLLASGGRICVLSYHSLEDRIVKTAFAKHSGRCTCPSGLPICVCGAAKSINVLTKRPVMPSESEIRGNPRSRSAKLRAAEKV